MTDLLIKKEVLTWENTIEENVNEYKNCDFGTENLEMKYLYCLPTIVYTYFFLILLLERERLSFKVRSKLDVEV